MSEWNWKLYDAAGRGDVKTVKSLLKRADGDVNWKDGGGWNALHEAAWGGHSDVISTLLSNGAHIDSRDDDLGMTALHIACRNGHPESASLLISKGADVHCRDDNGDTALHVAAYNCRLDATKVLLDAGADPHLKNKRGETPKQKLEQKRTSDQVAKDILQLLENCKIVKTKSVPSSTKASSAKNSDAELKSKSTKPKVAKDESKTAKDESMSLLEHMNQNLVSMNTRIDSSVSELNNRIQQLAEELRKAHINMKKSDQQIRELQNLIQALKTEMTTMSADLKKDVNLVMTKTDEYFSNSCQQDVLNEYVYYQIFHMIAQKVGSYPKKWKEMCKALLSHYCEDFVQSVMHSINDGHVTDSDKAYELLMRWKVFVASYADKTVQLKKVIMGLDISNKRDICQEIDKIIERHVDCAGEGYSGSLSDRGLSQLSSRLGSEWYKLALYLDFSHADTERLEGDYPRNMERCIYQMLVKWRDRETGFNDIKLARLTEALIRTERGDLARKLKMK